MKKRLIRDLGLIFLLGLIPLLWLHGNQVILGHDAGLALDPFMHFMDRIHVWSQRFSLGTDQNGALLGAFFIHGFEALLAYWGLNLHWGQIIQFVFWFALPGFAMYFFAFKMFPGKNYLPLIASLIYMLNFYILQGWFIAERTKFSIYIAFPIVLYFMIRYLTGKIGFVKSTLLTGIVLGIFNGGGSFPLYGGLVFSMICIALYANIISLSWKTLFRTLFYFLGIALFYFLFNAYWLIPYVYYLLGFFSRDLANAGGAEGALSWSRYLSANSSFINLFRGQGIPDWYLNEYHAYSQNFLQNVILIFLSFLFPIFAFSSLLIRKTKKESYMIYLLVLLCLVGVIFSSGPKSQLGFIYEFLVTYVPGFAMFRSAFFKFNYVVWFSYALLIGFTLDTFLTRLSEKYSTGKLRLLPTGVFFLIIIGYLFYHYPALDGSFLDYSHEPGKELTTRVIVPNYIFDFGEWVNNQDPNTRFLVMPQLGETPYISYEWKYWSLAPVTSLLVRNSFIHNTALAPENERILMEEMYAAFLRDDMQSFFDFVEVFAIDKIVVQKDYDWQNVTWGTVNPKLYLAMLQSHPELFKHEKTFGKWEVYSLITKDKALRINASSNLTYLQGKLDKVVSFPKFDPTAPLYMSDLETGTAGYYINNATDIYLAPECIQCDLEYKEGTFEYYNPKLLPGSIFYPFVTFREDEIKKSAQNFNSLTNYYITIASRRMIETKWMVDSGVKMNNVLPNIEKYTNVLQELKGHLEKGEWEASAFGENKMAQMVMEHLIQETKLIDSIYKSDKLNFFHRQALAKSYNEILAIRDVIDKKLWKTEDMFNKKYIYDLPLTGEYELYVKKGSLTNPHLDTKETKITFKDIDDTLTPIETIGDWIYFGSVNLKNKKTFISLRDGTMENLLTNMSPIFPDGDDGIIQEGNNFRFTTDSVNKCFYYQIENLDFLNTQYVVSFNYRNFSEKNTLSFFHDFVGDEFFPYSIREFSLADSRYPSKITKLITPKNGDIRLHFCNGFLSINELTNHVINFDEEVLPESNILIEIKDITFHKVAYPNMLLYKKQFAVEDTAKVKSFAKQDPVTYSLSLEETGQPFSIMMRESYGKYWELCDENKDCLPFDDKAHFANAGFTNAWFLKDTKLGNSLRLYYYPQKWYILGTIITLLSIGVVIIGWLWVLILKRK